ncbi:hypothetical protein D3C80_1584690 [compost metagenome]
MMKLVNIFLVRLWIIGNIINGVVSLTKITSMRAHMVNKNEFMLMIVMFEKPVNPPLFHESFDKIKIDFTVLHLKIQNRIGSR